MNNRQVRQNQGIVLISEYYPLERGPDDEKHESPTKRLIQQKNTTFEHKKVMKDNI